MGQTVTGMASAMKGMQVDQIAKTMADFEKQFEDMDVTSGALIITEEKDIWFLMIIRLFRLRTLFLLIVLPPIHCSMFWPIYSSSIDSIIPFALSQLFLLYWLNYSSCIDPIIPHTGYMEGAMEATTSMSTPPEQVDSLIQVQHKFIYLPQTFISLPLVDSLPQRYYPFHPLLHLNKIFLIWYCFDIQSNTSYE